MKAFTALLALASAANAHMILRTPTPAGNPDSSPLTSDGSNYPCKMAGGSGQLDTSKPNVMAIGSSQNLALTGGATHGGGSCQVSLAKGTTISKDMKFMVIHSIEGACPVGGSDENYSNSATDTGTPSHPFTIPDHPDLGVGDYTLAWTWNNKIGNREFYMNCAYVQLTAATKKRYEPSKPAVSRRDQAPLPDMFVANLANINSCTVGEGTDVLYPDPGLYAVKATTSVNLQLPTGSCGTVNSAGQAAASTAAATAAGTATSAVASNSVSPTSSSAANNGQYTQSQGGNFATVSGSSAAASTASATMASASAATSTASVVVASASASAASSASAPLSTGTGSTTSALQSGACTNEGAWACSADGKSFQRCASGSWSASMSMSAGTTCVPGISTTFAYAASGAKNKRDLRTHIARRRHNYEGATF